MMSMKNKIKIMAVSKPLVDANDKNLTILQWIASTVITMPIFHMISLLSQVHSY